VVPRSLRVFPDAGRVEHALLEASRRERFVDATGYWSFSQLVMACTPAGARGLSRFEGRLIISALARELPEGPFGHWAHDAIFAHEAAELFAQLESQLATPDQLERAGADTGSSRAAFLAKLWLRFRRKKAELEVAELADRLTAATAAVRRALPEPLRAFGHIALFGVSDLPPARLAFVHALDAACRAQGIRLSLHLPRADNPAIDALVNEIHSELERRHETSSVDLVGDRTEGPFARIPLFTEEKAAQAPGVEAFSAATPREEMREIARRVRRRLDAGSAPDEVAIVFRDLGPEVEALIEALSERGVPARARALTPFAATAVGHLALELPALVDDAFPAEAVARYASSRYLARLWENGLEPLTVFAQAGIRDDRLGAAGDRGAYEVRLTALATRFSEGWPKGPADEVRAVARQVERLIEAASLIRAEDTLSGHVQQWSLALERIGLHEGLRAVEPVANIDADDAAVHERALARDQAAGDALLALQRMLADAARLNEARHLRLSRREFTRWLNDAAAELNLVERGPRAGAVAILEAREVHGRSFRHIFIAGLVDGRFPARSSAGGLLSEDERGGLNGAARAPLFRLNVGEREARLPLKLAEDRLAFHLTLCASTETATLSHARAEPLGRGLAPSLFLQEVVRALEGFVVQRVPRPVVPEAEGVSNETEWRLRALLDGAKPEGAWAETALTLAAMEHERLRFFSSETAEAGAFSGNVRSHDLSELLGRELAFDAARPLTAHRLEAWGNCAFAGFLSDVLGLSPLEEQGEDLDSRSRGTFSHRVLELLLPVLREPPRELEPVVAAAVDEVARTHERRSAVGHPVLWKLARERLVRELTELIRSGRARPFPGLTPEKSELKFAAQLPVEEPVVIGGKVDRVDLANGSAGVVDYKSGKVEKAERLKRLLKSDWQLPVYAWAVRAAGLADRVEAAWLPIRNEPARTLSQVAAEAGVTVDELIATDELTRRRLAREGKPNLGNEVQRLVSRVRAGDFSARPEDCEHCRFRAVCRISTRKLHEEGR
jgi:ATP-dependent helicase/DNAse subunit B